MTKILIAGSGKTALDIGSYFLDRNHHVFWLTNSPDQKTKVEKKLVKFQRRRMMLTPDKDLSLTGRCYLLSNNNLPVVDVIIETTSEVLIKKQQLFTSLTHIITPQTLLFSNSSSFLPENIYPDCIGAHFLFPLLLTNLVELVLPPDCNQQKQKQSLLFFKNNGLDIIEQKSSKGFLINRLLLPIQAECFKALRRGVPSVMIDEGSKCGIFPIGQLSLMDRIGLDTIHSAAMQYSSFLEKKDLSDHQIMLKNLDELILLGKKGEKNRDGLLIGQPLPWRANRRETISAVELAEIFISKLRARCQEALDHEEITPKELSLVFTQVYQVDDFQLLPFLSKNEN